jgi:sugar O-acyltransferase (sialic acid O-acetyltransferase NeuD family)
MNIKKGKRTLDKNHQRNFAIIGTSGHAKVVYETFNLTLLNKFNFLGFITSDNIDSFLGCRILGRDVDAREIFKKYNITDAFIAIGSGFSRERIDSELFSESGVNAVNIIHPSAIIEKSVRMGAGNFIGAGAIINSYASIGDYCLINSAVIVEHDCILEDFVTVSPGAKIGGRVKIGNRSFIGIGANIAHQKIISDDVVIGAGATVVSDIEANSVAVGCPARTIRKRKAEEAYL